ncbi:hypothetical protein MNBD_GAMMA21-398 [hydrothermal vent metagenome]|uniref:Uncharacterized protein n=1 Tax=hydrothermal vent metagenome TaxID=652676 RepID=A0A3B1AFT3_9ZZZZ
MSIYDVSKLIAETRRLAADYRRATGTSLAVSSEIAKHDACELLQLKPAGAEDEGGYDATGEYPDWRDLKIQIKGRAIFDESKSGQRIGQLKLDKNWDAVVLVLMNEEFETQEIFMAKREEVEHELDELDGKRQNRGAMTIARFKHMARLVWTPQDGIVRN